MSSSQIRKIFGSSVIALAAGEARNIDTRGMGTLTVIAGTGATVTVSRVDDDEAEAHTTGSHNQFTVAATTRVVTSVDWPFYRISSAGGACRVAYS